MCSSSVLKMFPNENWPFFLDDNPMVPVVPGRCENKMFLGSEIEIAFVDKVK